MSDAAPLREKVARSVCAHASIPGRPSRCLCGWRDDDVSWADHAVDAVLAAVREHIEAERERLVEAASQATYFMPQATHSMLRWSIEHALDVFVIELFRGGHRE